MKKTIGYVLGAVLFFGVALSMVDDSEETVAIEEPVEEVEAVEEPVIEEPVEDVVETVANEEPVEEVVETVANEEPVEEVVETESIDYSTVTVYASTMEGYMSDLTTIMYDFSTLMTDAGNNPNLMFDENWTIDVATQLVLLQEVIDNVKAEEAPKGFETVHSLTVQAMDEYQFVVTNLPIAIDTMDVDLMNECTNAVLSGASFIGEASQLLSEKI